MINIFALVKKILKKYIVGFPPFFVVTLKLN